MLSFSFSLSQPPPIEPLPECNKHAHAPLSSPSNHRPPPSNKGQSKPRSPAYVPAHTSPAIPTGIPRCRHSAVRTVSLPPRPSLLLSACCLLLLLLLSSSGTSSAFTPGAAAGRRPSPPFPVGSPSLLPPSLSAAEELVAPLDPSLALLPSSRPVPVVFPVVAVVVSVPPRRALSVLPSPTWDLASAYAAAAAGDTVLLSPGPDPFVGTGTTCLIDNDGTRAPFRRRCA